MPDVSGRAYFAFAATGVFPASGVVVRRWVHNHGDLKRTRDRAVSILVSTNAEAAVVD